MLIPYNIHEQKILLYDRIMLQILKKMCVLFYLHAKSKHDLTIQQHIVLLVPRSMIQKDTRE